MTDRDDHSRRSHLASWVLLAAIVAMAVFMRADFVDIGLMGDDYAQQEMLRGTYGNHRSAWDLYRFVDPDPSEFARHRSRGSLPWWASPELRGSMFRPLASASLRLDHDLAPGAWRLHHVHSLAWWALAVLAAGLALRRALGRWLGLVALGLFVLDPSAVLSVGWLASRGILQSACFGFLALFFHLGPSSRARPWLTTAALILAMLAGEYGFAASAYVIAHLCVVERSSSGGPPRVPWRRALLYAAPATLYLVAHRGLGHGNNSGSLYVDPVATPARFLSTAATRLPQLLADLWLAIPASSIDLRLAIADRAPKVAGKDLGYEQFVTRHAIVAALALACLMALGWAARRAFAREEQRTVVWLAAGSTVGLVPLAAAPPHTRLLLLAALGSSAIAALAMAVALRSFRARQRRVLPSIATVAMAVTLLATQALLDPLRANEMAVTHRAAACSVHEAMNSPALTDEAMRDRHVVLISSHQQVLSFDGVAYMHAHDRVAPESWQTLCWAQFPVEVRRIGPETLELSALAGGHWLATPWERGFRVHGEPLRVGDSAESGPVEYTVVEADDIGPTKMRFKFERELDDCLWLVSAKDGLREFALPRPGQSVIAPLPRAPQGDPTCTVEDLSRSRQR